MDRGRLLMPALLALPAAAIAGALLLLRPAPPSPPPAPEPPSAAPADYADEAEDAVLEIEDLLIDFAYQLVRGAGGGALHHVAADFQGSPLLREAGGDARTVGGVRMASGGADLRRLDRAAFGRSLLEIPVDAAVFKLPSAELKDGSLACRLKLDARRVREGRARRWVAQGDAEFVRRGGRWLLRAFHGTDVKTEEGAVRFPDATAVLGLEAPLVQDERGRDQITFGRLFLGGIAAGDFDGDGDPDLYVPRPGANLLYRNEGGRFVECARPLGVADPDTGAAALFLDVDNDGDLDLWVSNFEPPQARDRSGALVDNAGRRAIVLYRNDGGKFTDVTRAAGLDARTTAMGACAADVDGDGDLDVFIPCYKDDSKEDPRFSEEVPAVVYGARDGAPDQLWINQGDGTFREEAAARGVADPGWGLAAAFADYDGDGDPDLYLANDYGEHKLYRNKGGGFFEEASGKIDTGFGMGVSWLDYDADGRLDLYVSNMYSTAGNRILSRGPGKLPPERHMMLLKMARGNTLLRNRGDGTFEDVTAAAGVGRAGWAWSNAAFDFDHDGRPDLYVANGFRSSPYATSDV
jgi:hypothetical protein